MLSKTLDSTLKNTELVFEFVKAGGYAVKLPMFTAFGIGLYALNKYTSRKRFHRKGEEHGSARWANKKEIQSLADKPKKVKLPFKIKVHNFFERLKFWKRRELSFEQDNNVVLTNEVKMSLNTRQTRKNLNVMVIGGSGSGKSRFYVKPNLMQANTSYVCTDPKGELLRSTGKMLESYGYDIRVFNLIDMAHSNNYNPFEYIYDVDGNYSATAVIKMVNVLMKNTSKENSGGDQFWDDSTKALLAALCFYLVECEDKSRQNFSEVMKLLKKAEVKEGDEAYMSDLDLIFDALEEPEKYTEEAGGIDKRVKELNLIDLAQKSQKSHEYMCLKYYKDFKKAAGDTAKSILISTAVRLQAFNIPEVMDLTCCDNIHLETIGDRPTAMFIIIPSSDDTFNFLAAMMYTQLFDVLYDRANFKYKGRLPVHVRCLLDEFANIGNIPRFEELLATMRSMEISANVIIQNLSQLKKMYKDSWENVLGNCDSLLFLGGQEPTTLEHISKTLGKETIDTRSHNRTRGRQGSTSENDSILGRELMTVDELKTMKDNECILFVRGIYPFFCNKYKIERHPNYKLLEDFNDDNAYLISDINTVKFGHESEDESDLHSEPVEDTEHGAVPEKIEMVENELDCHVESIDVGSQQPHSRIAEMQAAEAFMKRMPKVPEDGQPEPVIVDGTESLVAAEPMVTDNSRYIEVYEDNYLDDFYDDF
ncbi:VirD4-like conjugal transfer protein, CD1115 family [Ruminococcus sp. NK3A76]|uniref:VirD4-like conjugal transfer protein, CD1115 family n=1 Tax=Ruminococcus sp. NK3A76 TaxID=877411 RepID=UPI000689959F|nr:type IV secretory system conjugative DNA transfer family protein [Ruminococcus sp. NK3A76]